MIARRSFARLCHDERGAAAVEFAFMSIFFFGVMVVALDFGVYVQQKMRLGSAVEAGAILAFNSRDAVNASSISTYVQQAAGLTTAPTVNCNNGTTCVALAARTNTDYRCINSANGQLETTTRANGDVCPSGGRAGYYLRIVASRTYAAMVVPNSFLGGDIMSQTALVRLQ